MKIYKAFGLATAGSPERGIEKIIVIPKMHPEPKAEKATKCNNCTDKDCDECIELVSDEINNIDMSDYLELKEKAWKYDELCK